MLFQPAGHLTVGAAVGQHPNRSPVGAAVWRGVSVNRDQHVSALLPRHVRAPHHRDEVVAVARQHRFKLGIGIQQCLQAASDGDSYIFLFQAVRANGAWVLAAVTGINSHHYPIAGTGGYAAAARRDLRCGTRNHGRLIGERIGTTWRSTHRSRLWFRLTHHHRGFTRRWVHDHRCRRRGFSYCSVCAALGGDGEHHGIDTAVLACGYPGLRALGQIKHQPYALGVFRRAGTNAFHQVLAAEI
ncbi:hypothetical protein D3C72_1056390 [compost metagenome]